MGAVLSGVVCFFVLMQRLVEGWLGDHVGGYFVVTMVFVVLHFLTVMPVFRYFLKRGRGEG